MGRVPLRATAVLGSVVLASLACSGAFPEELLGGLPEVPADAPSVPGTADDAVADPSGPPEDADEVEASAADPAAPAATSALLGRLGSAVPLGAEVVEEGRTSMRLVHRDGNIEAVWKAYIASLEAGGWTRYRTAVPPFEGLFHRETLLVDLRLKQAGVTVTADLSVRDRAPAAP